MSLEEKQNKKSQFLGLTNSSTAVCGCAEFLMVLTLVGFQAVPVGMFVVTGVAEQGGSWKKTPTTQISDSQQFPPGEKSAKSLGKYKVESLV